MVALTRALVDIPSVSGEEGKVGEFLHGLLSLPGWATVRQQLAPGRFNVLAVHGKPRVLLTTHMDTVPPFFPSREDELRVWGRGSCDAKGIAAAMICAAGEFVRDGGTDLGLLFVAGEETDSIGARQAAQLELECEYLIDGEPTDNELAVGHKGVIQARLKARGKAAHSAYPERGESAIDKLIDVLLDLRCAAWPQNDSLGESHLNVGRISGGRAANVIADEAQADVLIRSVASSQEYVGLLREKVGSRVHLEILKTTEPQEMERVEGFPCKTVGFGTDIPVLRRLGRPLLIGPGSILLAHAVSENVPKKQLADAVGIYKNLVRLLQQRG